MGALVYLPKVGPQMKMSELLAPGAWVTVGVLADGYVFDAAHGRVDDVSPAGVLVQVVAWVRVGLAGTRDEWTGEPQPVIFPRAGCVFRPCALAIGEGGEPRADA